MNFKNSRGQPNAHDTPSLIWAKEKLAKLGKSIKETAVKRLRSAESDTSGAKKQRISHRTNITYSDVLKDSNEIAVVDRSDPDGSISPSNWRLVEDALVDNFLDVMDEHPGPILFEFLRIFSPSLSPKLQDVA